ncbi:MAG: cytochrome c3 family protein, partial [Fidelibacterota bacterium]
LQFRHDRHLTHGVTCAKCHSNLRIHGELLHTRAECLNCHHSQENTDCSVCHEEQQMLLSGRTPYFQGDPDLMWDVDVTCADCHLVTSGMVRRGSDLCAECHDESYSDMVLEWRQDIESLLRELPENQFSESIKWLTSEGSLGGHNPQAVLDYLESASQR